MVLLFVVLFASYPTYLVVDSTIKGERIELDREETRHRELINEIRFENRRKK